MKDTWKKVLETEDESEFLRRYAAVLELIPKSLRELERAGGRRPEIYLEHAGRLKQFIDRGLNEPFAHGRDDLNAEFMLSLKHGAHRAEDLAPKYEWEEGFLTKLEAKARRMLDGLDDTTAPPPLGPLIRKHLQSILTSINLFWIFGPEGLEERVTVAVGAIVVEAQRTPDVVTNEKVRGFTELLGDALKWLQVVKTGVDLALLGVTHGPTLLEWIKGPPQK